MSDRFFLDTNIFVYSFDRTAAVKARKAQQLIRLALTSQKGVVSYQVVQEFFNAALKRFVVPLTVSEAEQYLATVLSPMLSVHSSTSLYVQALRTRAATHYPWYDSLIIGAALQAKCDVLYTEDLQHGQKVGPLRIVNPFL
jgi:predicted nucleic acid-binding protein